MALQALATEMVSAFGKGDYKKTMEILPNIKLELAKAGLFVPTKTADKNDLMAVRQVLEIGVLASIHTSDEPEINRLIAQLRPFYCKELDLPQSKSENKLVGLYLLLLVAKNEIAEFHSELETLENPENDPYLAYPVHLERWLMEGSYDKVWKAITQESQFPSPEFALLAQSLVYTVRNEIALCTERAYDSLPLANARHLLFLRSDQEIVDFVGNQQGWTIRNGHIYFPSDGAINDDMETGTPAGTSGPYESLIANTLGYAQEIESII